MFTVDDGWVKIYRSLSDCKSASRGFDYIGAMVWLVINANREDNYYKGTLIKRGQLACGREQISKASKLSEQRIRTILRNLENDDFLTIKSTNKGSIATIVNYDIYQYNDNDNQPANQPAINQQSTTNKKYKKLENNININTSSILSDFLKFWDMYDLKADRAKCEKAFAKLSKADIEKLLEVLPRYVARTSKDRTPSASKTYRKNPLTWLNGKCWNDEVMKGDGLFDRNEVGF